MKTGTQDKESNQISMDKIDPNKTALSDTTQPVTCPSETIVENSAESSVSACSVENSVPKESCKSTDPITSDEGQVEVNIAILSNESSSTNKTDESSTTADNTTRRSGRKALPNAKLTTSSDSEIPVILVDSHSKLPVCVTPSQIAKNKHMAIKVVGKTDLSTQDLVAKAKKMLTLLTRSKTAKKSVAQNSKPTKKVVTSTPVKLSRNQRLKDDIMKELIASTPSGFSVTRTYSGLRDKLKDLKVIETASSSSTISPNVAVKVSSTSVPNLTSTTEVKSCPSSSSTSLAGCVDDINTIELFDDGFKPMTTSDVPSATLSSQDLLSKNRCAISICKHMSGECNLASRTSESSDGRAWYNFLRVADPAHYTTPTCPMKQIFLCFCHFSPEYIVYAPRLRSHSIPTIPLPRHLNQNSTVKNRSDRIKDERLLHKKLQDSEAKVRELEYKVKNMNSILSKFSQDELRKIQGRAVKWSRGTLEKALSVRALVGPSAYEHISKLFPLPSLRVLNNLPDEFLRELNVDKLSFPSKNKGKSKDGAKAKPDKDSSIAKKRKTVATKNQASTEASTSNDAGNELTQAIETINPQSVTAVTIPRTHLDEFASHALLDISHMYPSNPSMTTLSLSSLAPENSSLQMSQTFAEIDFSSFNASPSMPFTSSVLSTPSQATTVQTIHVTTIPSSKSSVSAPATYSVASRTDSGASKKSTSHASTEAAACGDSEKGSKSRSNSSAAAKASPSGIIYSRKRKLVITPRFGRNAPKATSVTGKVDTCVNEQTSTINLPDGNQLDPDNPINMVINLPPFESSASSSSSQKSNTYSNRGKNNSAPKSSSPHKASPTSQSILKSAGNSGTVSSGDTHSDEPAAKKSRQESPVKFELVATENLSSKERITVFNVLTEIHVKFKAQYHRCSTCCLFLHGDALNQFMRMVETNIVKYSHFLSDLASTSVKTFQEEMLQFVKKLNPDIFPKCPLYNEHLRFLIIEYISASINCKRSKMTSAVAPAASTSASASQLSAGANLNSNGKNSSKGQTHRSPSSTSSSLSSNDLVAAQTPSATDNTGNTIDTQKNDASESQGDKKLTASSGQPFERLPRSSSSSVAAALVS